MSAIGHHDDTGKCCQENFLIGSKIEIYELPEEQLRSISVLAKYDRFHANVGMTDVHTLVRPSWMNRP